MKTKQFTTLTILAAPVAQIFNLLNFLCREAAQWIRPEGRSSGRERANRRLGFGIMQDGSGRGKITQAPTGARTLLSAFFTAHPKRTGVSALRSEGVATRLYLGALLAFSLVSAAAPFNSGSTGLYFHDLVGGGAHRQFEQGRSVRACGG